MCGRSETMATLKVNEFAAVLVAAIALLGQVNGHIYQTNDAVVFESIKSLKKNWFYAV